MKITTLWEDGLHNEMPWLVAAYDEHTFDECGEPPVYTAMREKNPKRRELIIEIPDEAVELIFAAHEVQGEVIKPKKDDTTINE